MTAYTLLLDFVEGLEGGLEFSVLSRNTITRMKFFHGKALENRLGIVG